MLAVLEEAAANPSWDSKANLLWLCKQGLPKVNPLLTTSCLPSCHSKSISALTQLLPFFHIKVCILVGPGSHTWCCVSAASNSTAQLLANPEIPGRVTVHCWSKVLSVELLHQSWLTCCVSAACPEGQWILKFHTRQIGFKTGFHLFFQSRRDSRAQ